MWNVATILYKQVHRKLLNSNFMRTKDQKNVISIPDKAGCGFHWIGPVFSFSQRLQ